MDWPLTAPTGVILYGPPASGKDTITRALAQLDTSYAPFQRMKIGTGNAENYRLTSPGDLASLRASADVLYQNERYGNTYIVDRPHLAAMLGAGQTPVLHLGQIEGIHAVTAYPAHWITVLLWCSRETTAQRVHARGSDDVEARLTVWDETADDLKNACEADFDALLGTETMTPQHAARIIAALVIAQGAPTP